MNNILVVKFGGTQLKDPDSVRRACNLVADIYEKEKPDLLPVVVSAPGKINGEYRGAKVTDLLERIYNNEHPNINLEEVKHRVKSLASSLTLNLDFLDASISELERQIVDNVSDKQKNKDRSYSAIVGFGEKVQVETVGRFFDLSFNSLPNRWLNYNEFGMLTQEYRDADVLPESLSMIENSLSKLEGIVFLPGFISYNSRGELTTLGRDGSNFTATKIAEALLAKEVRIYSAEPGVRRAHPLFVPDAEIILELTYSEAREFSELGAKVINSKSIAPAQNENIPIFVVDENGKGTKIYSHVSLEHMGAKIIASVPNQSVLTIQYEQDKAGILEKVANSFASAGINIDAIADERHGMSLAFSGDKDIGKVLEKLRVDKYILENHLARISIIGEGMENQVGVIEKIGKCYRESGISFKMISQAMPQLNVTSFIDGRHERIAVRRLYDAFFGNGKELK